MRCGFLTDVNRHMNSSMPNSWPDKGIAALAQQQATITAILDRLDSGDDARFRNRRQAIRHKYRRIDTTIRAFHPGGSVAFGPIAMRNLSSTGAGFLYTGFLHIGTRVELMLPRLEGGEDILPGKIIFCGHITGQFHQIGVRFDDKITPRHYVDIPADKPAAAPAFTLGGIMLHIDDSKADRELMARSLGATQIALTSVANPQDAVAAIKARAYDLVLCDANLQGVFGDEVIGHLRDAGYKGKVVAVASADSTERIQLMQKAGAVDLLSKPYSQKTLFSKLGTFLKRVPSGAGIAAPVHSTKSEMASLLDRYMQIVKQLAADIERATKEHRLDQMEQICSSLSLAEAARTAMQNLSANSSVETTNAEIKKLFNLCKSMIAP